MFYAICTKCGMVEDRVSRIIQVRKFSLRYPVCVKVSNTKVLPETKSDRSGLPD